MLSLLASEITDASRLMTARPVEQTTRDGRDCLIYRTTLPAKNGEIDIEAAVDSKNLQLLEIAAWKPENKRKGPPLAEMTLVALNVAVADEQFAVSKSLSEDGRIGSIGDAQGSSCCGRDSRSGGLRQSRNHPAARRLGSNRSPRRECREAVVDERRGDHARAGHAG